MEFYSTTGKIPKGYGFILKPSSLAAALRSPKIETDVTLTRHHSRGLFDAHFWTPNPNVPFERLYITVVTVATLHLRDTRAKVENEAIPKLVEWIATILAQDPKSPVRRQSQMIQLLPPRDV